MNLVPTNIDDKSDSGDKDNNFKEIENGFNDGDDGDGLSGTDEISIENNSLYNDESDGEVLEEDDFDNF
eukprot:14110235-Ditylum_brightwellii.AAC.1